MTRLESAAPNDSNRTRLADFCGKWLQSTQLQLVQNKFIKIIVIVLLGKNNESCEQWELRNFIRKYIGLMGICLEYIPDGHAYYISVILFLETTLVPRFLKWSLDILCTYTKFDRLFWYLWSAAHFKLTYKAWLIKVYLLLISSQPWTCRTIESPSIKISFLESSDLDPPWELVAAVEDRFLFCR
jgi:hypothetical protein